MLYEKVWLRTIVSSVRHRRIRNANQWLWVITKNRMWRMKETYEQSNETWFIKDAKRVWGSPITITNNVCKVCMMIMCARSVWWLCVQGLYGDYEEEERVGPNVEKLEYLEKGDTGEERWWATYFWLRD